MKVLWTRDLVTGPLGLAEFLHAAMIWPTEKIISLLVNFALESLFVDLFDRLGGSNITFFKFCPRNHIYVELCFLFTKGHLPDTVGHVKKTGEVKSHRSQLFSKSHDFWHFLQFFCFFSEMVDFWLLPMIEQSVWRVEIGL